jgi:molybdopterin converting factor small subunit
LLAVQVKLFGVFRSAAKASEIEVPLREENPTVRSVISQLLSQESFASLRELLLDLETADPRPNALIMVSGREISTLDGLETKLGMNDELSLLPVVHGG